MVSHFFASNYLFYLQEVFPFTESYGINYEKLGRQTAAMAVKVLKGAKPSELPIEYQKDMDIAVNQAAARQLGVTLPQSLLSRTSSAAK